MISWNNCTFIGNIFTENIDVKKTQSGKSVVDFTISIYNGKKEDGTYNKSDYVNCRAWNQIADYLGQNAIKGQEIAIEGRYKTDSWKENEGLQNEITRYKTYILVDKAKLFGNRQTAQDKPKSEPSNQVKNDGDWVPQDEPHYQQESLTGNGNDVNGFAIDSFNGDYPFY